MFDKRYLKVRKLGEERYFEHTGEFVKFIEKQSGLTFDEKYKTYDLIVEEVKKGKMSANASKRYWETQINFENDKLVIGNFIFQIFRAEEVFGEIRTFKEYYTINILAVGKADLLSQNDLDKLFSEEIQKSGVN